MTSADKYPYRRIAAALLAEIHDGLYGDGAALPSENDLSARFGVAPLTARNALKALVNAGVLSAERAKGHYVRTYQRHPINTSLAGGGREVGSHITVQIIQPPAHVAELMPGVTSVVRRRAVGTAIKDTFYPRDIAALVPALEDPAPLVEPPDTVLLAEAGIELASPQRQSVIARMPAPGEEAALLDPPEGTPLLEQVTVLRDRDGRTVLVRVALYRGDLHLLEYELPA